MNQESIILGHLMRHGSISGRVAVEKYGIQKLSARIRALRKLGLTISTRKGNYILEEYRRPARKQKCIGEDDLFPGYENE